MADLFPQTVEDYARAREALLEHIIRVLESDARFAAAWLIGSIGRGEQDAVSDIDLVVVVDPHYSKDLCARPVMTSSGSIPARLAVFEKFGEPASIHENHHNAPEGGSFSSVLYRQPPLNVDCSFVPLGQVCQPVPSRLLFDRVGVPLCQAEEPSQLNAKERSLRISERTAFFWMMAAVTAKYIVRVQAVRVQELLRFEEEVVGELEYLLGFEPEPSANVLSPIRADQTARLRALCERVEALGVPAEPRAQVEAILNLTGEV